MTKIIKLAIRLYQFFISYTFALLFGKGCKFTPTCSEYMSVAVNKYGPIKGTLLGLKRFSRCRPGTLPGYDPVN